MEAYNQNKYTCIIYPGIVNDTDKMLDTLGGLEKISLVCSKPNRRLELRFKPENVYCRPTCGDRKKTVGFLLKVKVKRKKRSNEAEADIDGASENVVCEPVVMGHVETTFQFKSLCDFQYLPMAQNEQGEMKNVYKELMPDGFPSIEWLQGSAPPFLSPPTFSRMDTVQLYLYRKESAEAEKDRTPANIIGRTRRRRSIYAVFVTFDVPAAPSKPRPNALKFLELKFLAGHHYAKMKELFEQRPVWSKIALRAETGFTLDQLKYLLPAVAYYFVTGPFRVMWVRMGYDPRKDPNARIYQTLDYRIPSRGGLRKLVKAKRSTDKSEPLSESPSNLSLLESSIKKDSVEPSQEGDTQTSQDNQALEKPHIFRPGTMIPARQMFYQFCDIKVAEIEDMLARLPRPGPDSECHRQRGWLPPGFAQRCREIISQILTETEKEMFAGMESEGMDEDNNDESDEDFEEEDDDADDGDVNEGNNSEDYESEVEDQTVADLLNP